MLFDLQCFEGKSVFENELDKLGYENISMDDVQRMQWESLEKEMASWINIIKHCSTNLFSGERKLCDSIVAFKLGIAEGE
ncbi:hypothetical protein SLA2020_169780 [Shorea laevis]